MLSQKQLNQLCRIPAELKDYRQFVCWRYEPVPGRDKPTKIPYNPLTGQKADVTNPNTWASFDDAANAAARWGYDGIGFVFTDNDPFFGIDLDENNEVANRVYAKFNNTYAELSPSGNGCHIIGIGSVPSGRRRGGVEVYSSKRYFTMTGNVCEGRDLPLSNCQELLTILWKEMGGNSGNSGEYHDEPQTKTDQEVLDACYKAKGNSFLNLWNGNWPGYPSQSEADQAFVNMIAARSRLREQTKRLFRMSGLGQRKKANRDDYVDGMINRAFADLRKRPDLSGIDFGNILELANDVLVQARLKRRY